ncbi:unnamed protein product [Rotaria socialis]|uniref:Uncharacterized protein n=2 Tax=Rotaria socialis TaxID=392032 RepID=A0A821VLG3_9BILA|nr:unnamed protein product [Rotaria socialis]
MPTMPTHRHELLHSANIDGNNTKNVISNSNDQMRELRESPFQKYGAFSNPIDYNQEHQDELKNDFKKGWNKVLGNKPSSKMVCFLVAFIVCGIPLTVFVTLWMTSRSTSTITSTATTASVSLPIQCYTYSTLTEVYRNYQNGYACCWSPYDTSPSLTPGWYRFTGSAGSSILTTPVLTTNACGTSYPGYFNGTLPSTVGASVTGTVCFYTGTSCGYSLAPITAVNCSGYYVFYLLPVVNSNYRYCSTA